MHVKLETIVDEGEVKAFLPIPWAVLKELGWEAGDLIEIDINVHGDIVLQKVK